MTSDRPPVTLRPAREDDAGRLLEWRNDHSAVRFSGTGRAVTADEHERWLLGRLEDSAARLWVAELESQPVGQVRIDADGAGGGTVSVAVAAEHRGRGIGTEMIRRLLAEVAAEGRTSHLIALAHPENGASLGAFQKAGFRPARTSDGGYIVLEWP